MEHAPDAERPRSEHESDQPRPLRPAPPEPPTTGPTAATGGGDIRIEAAGKIVDSLRASAEQEFQIAERLSTKSRQAFAFAAGVFTVAQAIAFSSFEASMLSPGEKRGMIVFAVIAVLILAAAIIVTLRADDVVPSRDLPLDTLENDLNAAYEGDQDVIGRLGGYYLGVVRTRRASNDTRRVSYRAVRVLVVMSLAATVVELIVALIARTN